MFLDGAAGLHPGQKIVGDAPQPGAVLRSVVDADQESQRQEHASNLLGETIRPLPPVRVGLHSHAYGTARFFQELPLSGQGVGVQESSPQIGLVVRSVVDVFLVVKKGPAAAFTKVVQIDARMAEAQRTGGAQIGQQAFENAFIPAGIIEQTGDGQGRQKNAGIVVAVEHRAALEPVIEAIGRVAWIVVEEVGRGKNIVEDLSGQLAAGRIAGELPVPGKEHSSFARAVAAHPGAALLTTVMINAGFEAL